MRNKAMTVGELEEFRNFQVVEKTFADVIDEAAMNHPDRVAVISGGTRLTFSQIHSQANKVAKGLIKLGMKKGEHVALLMQNIPEWPTIVFAIAKAGAITVTCNTRFKKEELQYVLNKSEASTLVMASEFPEANINYTKLLSELAPELSSSEPGKLNLSQLPAIRRIIILGSDVNKGCYTLKDVEEIGRDVDDETLSARQRQVRPDDTAAILFTSGTTGFPKGCVLRHNALITSPAVHGKIWRLSERDVVLAPIGLFTVYGLALGMFMSFHYCASLVLEKVFDTGEMLELIEKERITILLTVPTMIARLFEHPNFSKTDFSSLRGGNIGGSLCPPEMLRRVRSDKKGWGMNCPEMLTAYGLTETHSGIITGTMDDPEDKVLYNIGRAFPFAEIRIVNTATGEQKGVGEEGELIIRGLYVMTEYFKEPDQTAEAIKDGWLYTKDLATMDEDGYVKITGRVSDMIISGGFNVFPKEIENKILEHPQVMAVSVFRVPDKTYGEVPAAHIILKPNTSVEESEIIEHCKDELARYKVPKYVKFVEEFPLSSSGKVQKFKQSQMMAEELGLK